MTEALLPFSSDAREHRFASVADSVLPKEVRRLNESQLLASCFELAMEHALLQTWTGYSKELTTACKLFGINLKSVEAKVRKALKDAETSEKHEQASGVATDVATAREG